MVGTLYNAGAVALGAAVGLAFRGLLTESGKDAAFLAAGLFTLLRARAKERGQA